MKNQQIIQKPEIVSLAKQAVAQYQKQNPTSSQLLQIYRSVKSNPRQLNEVNDFASIDRVFYLMFAKNVFRQNKHDLNLYKDRLLLLEIGHEPFSFTQ